MLSMMISRSSSDREKKPFREIRSLALFLNRSGVGFDSAFGARFRFVSTQ